MNCSTPSENSTEILFVRESILLYIHSRVECHIFFYWFFFLCLLIFFSLVLISELEWFVRNINVGSLAIYRQNMCDAFATKKKVSQMCDSCATDLRPFCQSRWELGTLSFITFSDIFWVAQLWLNCDSFATMKISPKWVTNLWQISSHKFVTTYVVTYLWRICDHSYWLNLLSQSSHKSATVLWRLWHSPIIVSSSSLINDDCMTELFCHKCATI